MQVYAKEYGLIYNGREGVFVCGNFPADATVPPEKPAISVRMLAGTKERAMEIVKNLPQGNFEIKVAQFESIRINENTRYDNIQNACLVITGYAPIQVCTNVIDKNLAIGFYRTVLGMLLEQARNNFGQPNENTVNEPTPQPEHETNSYKNVPNGQIPGLTKKESKTYHELIDRIEWTQGTLKQYISIDLFYDGVVALTCSSKEEYLSMKEFISNMNIVVSRSVNEEGWDDVCKYVYVETVYNDDEPTFIAKAHFKPVETIDRIMPFSHFYGEWEILDSYTEILDDSMKELSTLYSKFAGTAASNNSSSDLPFC